ncbi:DUF1638 domain-containing protein [Meridianimarinicoccus sp. MJW13]|uniref:DUF1638 domain-containing protein n=1 Tax=Meridianimarinicoccus sp. MJW13 TaxID=2720031 RepID=UPI001867B378|nr:DUF1638 domain-containing protein [Fluviibacterium sp. MJW13]
MPDTQHAPPDRILIIGCGAIAREILALKEANGWDHLDLTCVPAIYHNHPEKIPGAVRELHAKHHNAYDRIDVAFADCGTGGLLQNVCDELGMAMIAGPHCYAFFQGAAAPPPEDDMTAFYLTDFLVRQFDAFVWKPLGLDRHPELRDMYFSHYERLIYLAQVPDPELDARARDCAQRLGLAFERRETGFGGLADWMATRATPA